MKPTFFRTPAEFRKWLERHSKAAEELLVGFYKAGSGKASITWPESVDEALCFGWIDGVRKNVDELSYTIRFTPRKRGSTWSSVNIRKVQALIKDKRIAPAGLEAFESRSEKKSGIYSYEQRPSELTEPYAGMLARNRAASEFFKGQAPWYRRAAIWWVIGAKKEETRLKRIQTLIDQSKQSKLLPHLDRKRLGS